MNAGAKMVSPLTLKLFKGNVLISSKRFERDIIKIGRLNSAHLFVDDEKVSRVHAIIDASGPMPSITDMGAAEGTRVNGKRINKSTLAWGDEITIGNSRIVIEQPGVVVEQPVEVAPALVPTPAPVSAPVSTPAPVTAPVAPVQQAVVVNAAPVSLPAPTIPTPSVNVPNQQLGRRYQGNGALGLQVRFVWGDQILAVHQLEKPRSLRVGSTDKCDFALSSKQLGTSEFELLRGDALGFVLNVPIHAVGEIDDGTGPVQIKDCKRLNDDGELPTLKLGRHDVAWLDLGGGVRAEFAFAPMPRKVIVPLNQRVDFSFLNLLLLALLVTGGFVIGAKNFDTTDDNLADDLLQHPAAVARFLVIEKKTPPPMPTVEQKHDNEQEASPKPALTEKDGLAGQKNHKPDPKARSSDKSPDPKAKDQARRMVAQLFDSHQSGIRALFQDNELGGGVKKASANVVGERVGDAGGLDGLTPRDNGGISGGIGKTIGIGAVTTHGKTSGEDDYGKSPLKDLKKTDADPEIDHDGGVITSSVDKDLIRQVIHRNRAQIRYCYEQQLVQSPKLEAKVIVSFTIGASGAVQDAKIGSSNSGSNTLDQCLVTHFKSWEFPKPKGGGIVQVSYPVILTQAGQ
jgi:TonB family protein